MAAGKDATEEFEYFGHSDKAREQMAEFLVGRFEVCMLFRHSRKSCMNHAYASAIMTLLAAVALQADNACLQHTFSVRFLSAFVETSSKLVMWCAALPGLATRAAIRCWVLHLPSDGKASSVQHVDYLEAQFEQILHSTLWLRGRALAVKAKFHCCREGTLRQ